MIDPGSNEGKLALELLSTLACRVEGADLRRVRWLQFSLTWSARHFGLWLKSFVVSRSPQEDDVPTLSLIDPVDEAGRQSALSLDARGKLDSASRNMSEIVRTIEESHAALGEISQSTHELDSRSRAVDGAIRGVEAGVGELARFALFLVWLSTMPSNKDT